MFVLISSKPLTVTINCLPNFTGMVSVVMFYRGRITFSLVVRYRQLSYRKQIARQLRTQYAVA